jgi:hypothetical protein
MRGLESVGACRTDCSPPLVLAIPDFQQLKPTITTAQDPLVASATNRCRDETAARTGHPIYVVELQGTKPLAGHPADINEGGFGAVNSTVNNPRLVHLALKLSF